MNLDLSLWLIPEKSQELRLQEQINHLAQKYSSFPFIPHLTVYYFGSCNLVEDIVAFIDKNQANLKQFTIDFEEVSHSQVFTKTIFAKYKISEPLVNLYSMFYQEYKKINDYQLAPHLSLIYKRDMKEADKLKEIASFQLEPQLTINRLYVIGKPGGTITQETDVRRWQVIADFRLDE